ncbi:MAG TPA: fibronectin type III domain-containing protein, partial [Puia sp.]|nr:fibronectin type III domain-containing protein [Puia sp.]
MKNSTRIFAWLLIVFLSLFAGNAVRAQSILNPSDTIVTFNPADTPAIPAYGSIAKWIRTVRMSWNTDNWKCYIYNGKQFRLRFPLDYNPTANDGKVYPMLIFMHGDGEGGSVYDNEYSLYHGGDVFDAAVSNGTFDGYVLVMQTSGSWGPSEMVAEQYIVDYMIANNKLDPFRVYLNGLSAGGAGDWEFLESAPTYPAAVLPMSSVAIAMDASDTVAKYKYAPIWCITGGLDGSPAPYTAQQVDNAFSAAGANYTYLDMTTQGHDTWDSAWSMATFWPWLKAQYSSNPWTLFGRTQFCSSDSVNLTVGLTAGFQGYQWRKNGVAIPGATSNTINVTSVGTYDARVERKGIWSNWSPVPTVISIKAPTVTPPITVSGLMSDVLPGTDNKNFVTLTVPDSNYTSYTWEKVGKDSVIGTQSTLKVTQPGQYIVSVTQQFGCSSNFSPPFRVVDAAGPNAPSAATNLIAAALSFTQVQLEWARNPHPTNPETGFEIYRATNVTGPYTFAGIVPADTVDFLDRGLTPNTQYYYVVRAVDSTGAAALSNQATVITQSDKTPPTTPPNLRVVTTSSTSVTLGWNSSTDNVAVTGYYIYVNGAKSYATAAGDTTFVVSDLDPTQEYSFNVVAVDASGNASIHSNQVSGATVNNGLFYSYYNLSTQPGVMPNFATLTPTFSGNMPNVSIANATATTNFAYEWNGYINIPVTGNYV